MRPASRHEAAPVVPGLPQPRGGWPAVRRLAPYIWQWRWRVLIALAFLAAGLRVCLIDTSADAVASGRQRVEQALAQDLERGRPMEIEALVGAVAELGRVTQTPTPAIDAVLALVRLRAKTAAA